MHDWSPERVAEAAGARLAGRGPASDGPRRAVVDSREAGPGDLFVGLAGENVDGGRFASAALDAGVWGVLVSPEHAGADGTVLVADDPLASLQRLATAWRRALGAKVIGITGSTGKTSTKDLLAGMLRPHRRTIATPQNWNTEIGLPLTVLGAPADTEVLVLEMAMRGAGQIAELTRIAEPDVGVITNVGPVHLELLGSLEAIRETKLELVRGLRPGGVAIVPAELAEHVPGAVVPDGDLGDVEIPFDSAHMRRNAALALAAAMRGDHAVPDAAAATTLVAEVVRPGDTVLVKASRGVGLEAVAEALV